MRISGCANLRKLIVPNKSTKFDPWAFLYRKEKHLTIYGKKDSGAYRAAKRRKIGFVEIN